MASSALFQNSKAGCARRDQARSSGEIFKCCGRIRSNSTCSLRSSFSMAWLISVTVFTMARYRPCVAEASKARSATRKAGSAKREAGSAKREARSGKREAQSAKREAPCALRLPLGACRLPLGAWRLAQARVEMFVVGGHFFDGEMFGGKGAGGGAFGLQAGGLRQGLVQCVLVLDKENVLR